MLQDKVLQVLKEELVLLVLLVLLVRLVLLEVELLVLQVLPVRPVLKGISDQPVLLDLQGPQVLLVLQVLLVRQGLPEQPVLVQLVLLVCRVVQEQLETEVPVLLDIKDLLDQLGRKGELGLLGQ